MKRWACASLALALLHGPITLTTRVACAQEAGGEGPLAETLYQEGRKLMAMGNVAEACPKFAESYRLERATGTLLNLASCHEKENKLATAWFEFSGAVALARRDRREDRVRFAQARLAGIEPRLSYLTVIVEAAVDVAGLEVRVDGVLVSSVARGVSTPIDPGDHKIDARAPGRKPWSHPFGVTQDSMNVVVNIPALEPDPASNAPTSEASAVPVVRVERDGAPIPTSVYVAGGATLILTAAAGITGYVYMQHRSEEGAEQREPELGRNRTLGFVNLGLVFAALAGAGVTGYLYWSRPANVGTPTAAGRTDFGSHASSVGMRVAPWLGHEGGGLCVQGSL